MRSRPGGFRSPTPTFHEQPEIVPSANHSGSYSPRCRQYEKRPLGPLRCSCRCSTTCPECMTPSGSSRRTIGSYALLWDQRTEPSTHHAVVFAAPSEPHSPSTSRLLPIG